MPAGPCHAKTPPVTDTMLVAPLDAKLSAPLSQRSRRTSGQARWPGYVPIASLRQWRAELCVERRDQHRGVTGGAFGSRSGGIDGHGHRLTVTNAASGLTLTDGTAITLSLDRVVGSHPGTVGNDAANPELTGQVAFAIAIDPLTGQGVCGAVSVAASERRPPRRMTCCRWRPDGRSDVDDRRRRRRHLDGGHISTHINFLDDGPSNISSRGQLAERLRVRNCTFGCRYQY